MWAPTSGFRSCSISAWRKITGSWESMTTVCCARARCRRSCVLRAASWAEPIAALAPDRLPVRLGVILAALAGLALAAYFVISVGFRSILSAMLAVGWVGFAVLCFCGAALFMLLGTAWFSLVPRHEKPRLVNFVWSRAVRECAGELLPFSQFGGIVIGARALMLRRVSASLAFASSIVDVTVEMVAQIVFVLAGLAIVLALA